MIMMMKKIIILLAILACGVGEVKAAPYTFRIYAERQFYDGWGNDVKVYVNYWNGSIDVELINNQSLSYAGQSGDNYHMFYTDLTIDDEILNSTYGVKLKFNNGGGIWTESHSEIKDFTSKNYVFYIYNEGGVIKQSYEQYVFKFAKSGANVLNDVQELTPENNILSTIVDNEASITEAWYVLYPSFATSRFTTAQSTNCINWNLVIRPSTDSGNYDITSFVNYDGNLLHNGGTGLFYVNSVNAKNTFTFDLTNMSFSVRPYFTRNINSIGYSTFSSDYAVAIPEDVTAYYASGANSSTKKVTMTKFTNGIAANTGALLYKSGGGEVTFTPATLTDAATGNLMKPGTGEVVASAGTTYRYALAKNKSTSEIYFAKLAEGSTNTVAIGKAYLEVTSGAAPSFEIFFDDAAGGTTAIDAVKSAEPAVTDGAYYNLAGQRVTNPTKGLYIVNGRKVVVK